MSKHSKTNTVLSIDMTKLKKRIKKHKLNTPVEQKIHENSSYATKIMYGITNVFNVISAFLNSYREIPLIGGALQLLAIIAQSISIVSDPKKSITEKIVSSVLIATLVTLSIIAFTLGALAAAIIGTIVSSVITIIEGAGFFGKIVEKFKLSNSYKLKKEFTELVDNRTEPKNNRYNKLFEIRAIELRHELEKPNLNKSEKKQLNDELNFINEVLKNKKIIPGKNKNRAASKLQKLYAKRSSQLQSLVDKIALINSASKHSEQNALLNEIKSLQKKIITTDNRIKKITPRISKLEQDNQNSTLKLLLSYTTFAIAGAGTILSVTALLVAAGTIIAPPFMLPVVAAIGVVMAITSLIKWTAEKITEMEEAQLKAKETAAHEEAILDEALNAYDRELNPDSASHSSHAKHMKNLLSDNDETTHVALTEDNVISSDNAQPLFSSSLSRKNIKTTQQEPQEVTTEKLSPTK